LDAVEIRRFGCASGGDRFGEQFGGMADLAIAFRGAGGYRSGQTGQTVNLMAYAFAGSNPAPPSEDEISDWGFRISDWEQVKVNGGSNFAFRNPKSAMENFACGCSSMVEQQPSKLMTRVRFPSPALEGQELRVKSQELEEQVHCGF
jgi:hypothetical protein